MRFVQRGDPPDRLLDGSEGRIDAFPGLASWVRGTEGIWEAHRSSDRLSLVKQLDYMRKLTRQLPPSPIRVVYGKAGMHVAAGIVSDPRAIIDHKLYWASVSGHEKLPIGGHGNAH